VPGFSNSLDGQVTGKQGATDYWIVKLNSSGILLWEQSLGGFQDDRG